MRVGAQSPAAYLRTPEPRQVDWHQLEYYAFIHFGHNTFTNEEWGRSQSTPDVFNPTNLDTDQWAEEFSKAGFKGMILTAKHHDGMALWNTTTTAYKIENSVWAANRTAQRLETDVVRLAAASAKKYGLRFGVYLSPWDMHRDPAMPKPHLVGTIYDEPQIFGDSNPGDYNEFYSQQLTELVTMKHHDGSQIDLFEIWLDGASGSSTRQTFAWTMFRDIIRKHQPGALMWGHQGVDARWVGNEEGYSLETNWHTINSTQDDARLSEDALMLGVRDGLYWTPAESDARIRDGWFWHSDEHPKSGEALMEMYLETVGRSVTLLLDVPPNTQGLIEKEDIESLRRFRDLRESFLEQALLHPETNVTASSIRGNNEGLYGPEKVLDGNPTTYWTMDDGQLTGWVEIDLGRVCSIEGFVTQEHIALGQRIGGYSFDALVDGGFKTVVNGTSLGYKRIDTLSSGLKTSRIRFRVTQSNAVPLVQSIQVLGGMC
ncbi:alpha-L-fucosidase 1 [Stachybotrys elegans]|uniref:alpha-L-fucosidase n=1 Tax=Stachybotrys elegans TaxID=80388 RepID=A0A8K0SP59_9HYPO|nr:alpha-L-fucosidase 1 [Stachybotrys elegans]